MEWDPVSCGQGSLVASWDCNGQTLIPQCPQQLPQVKVFIFGRMADLNAHLSCFVYKAVYFFLCRVKINHIWEPLMCDYSWDCWQGFKQLQYSVLDIKVACAVRCKHRPTKPPAQETPTFRGTYVESTPQSCNFGECTISSLVLGNIDILFYYFYSIKD